MAQTDMDSITPETRRTDMKRLTHMMRHELPTHRYREFVLKYVAQEGLFLPLDPFTTDIPPDTLSEIYVDRQALNNELTQAGSQIILGLSGSGKSTLFRLLPELLATPDSLPLVVSLSVGHMGLPIVIGEGDRAESLLTPEVIARHIFGTLWEKRAQTPDDPLLEKAGNHRPYWERFRWFYHHFSPRYPDSALDFAMQAWLSMEPKPVWDAHLPPRHLLQQLVKLVTYAPEKTATFGTVRTYRPYDSVLILIDGAEKLPGPAQVRLLQDIQELHNLYIEKLHFKVFLNESWQALARERDCVREGHVGLLMMPDWSPQELKEMLARRMLLLFPDSSSAPPLEENLPAECIEPSAKAQLVQTIVRHAQLSRELDGMDAPVHALRLTRAILAACAGCFSALSDPAVQLPLSVDRIEQLCLRYRGEES